MRYLDSNVERHVWEKLQREKKRLGRERRQKEEGRHMKKEGVIRGQRKRRESASGRRAVGTRRYREN